MIDTPLSPAEARWIDEACDAFEAAWKAGTRPRPEDYLTAADPARSALVRQLLLLDWEYRSRAGDQPTVDDYRQRFAADAAVIENVGRELAAPAGGTLKWPGDTPAGCADQAGGGEPTGEHAGRYQLLGEIGRGGIGMILRGHDRHLGREVAVKVLQPSYRDHAEALDRFAAEARIGSQLQHPAIVPVYEMGRFDDGRPFFTMKLVGGQTLSARLKARADLADDRPRLLAVFEQVCQAVAYAHARGVIHRDLKPANVMVGAFGEVQVMDWGLAKVLAGDGDGRAADPRSPAGRSDVTQDGAFIGTPSYMPPEQARDAARAGPPADVFALGAILCVILTGHPPYGRGDGDVCDQAVTGDTAAARARLAACGADAALQALAADCLAADPAARPADAGVVARAITDYLAAAEERARRAQLDRAAAEAKARADRRTRRLSLGFSAAVLVGAAVATWQAVAAVRAKRLADAKAAETRAVLDFVATRVLAAARPEGEDGGLGRDVTLRAALDAALPTVATQFAGQPLTEARVRVTLGDSFQLLGDAKAAADQFERGRALFLQRLGPDDPATLQCTDKLAQSYSALDRRGDALRLGEEAVARFRATAGPDHPNTLSATSNLTLIYDAAGRHADALRERVELLPKFSAAFGPDHRETLLLTGNLALSYQHAGRHADALRVREDLVPRLRTVFAPDHPEALRAANALAASYYTVGRYADALAEAGRVLPLQRAKLGPDHVHTLQTMNTMAGCHQALGRPAESVRLLEAILKGFKARLPAGHPKTLITMNNLANGYAALGQHDDALKLREETVKARREADGPDHPATLTAVANLANSFADLGRHAAALELRQDTLRRQTVALGPDHPDTLQTMADVASSLVELDRGAEAVPLVDDCLRRAAGRAVAPDVALTALDARLRHFARAKDAAECRATAERWEAFGRTDPISLYTATRFRAVTAAVGGDAADADKAVAWLGRAIAAGYKNVENVRTDADLTALRDRPDYQRLMAEWKP